MCGFLVVIIHLMKHKYDVNIIFRVFHRMVMEKRAKDGRECFNQSLLALKKKKELFINLLILILHNEIRVVEWKNRHLLKVTRHMIFQMNVSKAY